MLPWCTLVLLLIYLLRVERSQLRMTTQTVDHCIILGGLLSIRIMSLPV